MLSIGGKSKNGNKALDDDVLLRAKELLFEKTKICKKLELQMEALNNQVVATKDALDITKSMLNLKNVENDHLESRLEAMQSRVKCERDRANLIEKKLNVSQQKGDALTKEYDLQRNIFKVCLVRFRAPAIAVTLSIIFIYALYSFRICAAPTRKKSTFLITKWQRSSKKHKHQRFSLVNKLFEIFNVSCKSSTFTTSELFPTHFLVQKNVPFEFYSVGRRIPKV